MTAEYHHHHKLLYVHTVRSSCDKGQTLSVIAQKLHVTSQPHMCYAIPVRHVNLCCTLTGQVTIPGEISFQLDSELNVNPPEFTLTCTSTGGPATTVSWTRGSTALSGTYKIVSDTEMGTYDNTLTVGMRDAGTYVCSVSNSRSSATANLTVVGKNSCSISCQLSAGANYRHHTLGDYFIDLYGERVVVSLLHTTRWMASEFTKVVYERQWNNSVPGRKNVHSLVTIVDHWKLRT